MSDLRDAINLTIPDAVPNIPEGNPILTGEVIARFKQVADGYRDTLRKVKVAEAERRYGKDSLEAKNAANLQLTGDMNPFKYVKFAFDSHGRLSVGRPKVRRKPHRPDYDRLLSQTVARIVEAGYAVLQASVKGKVEATQITHNPDGTNIVKHEEAQVAGTDIIKLLNRSLRKAKAELRTKFVTRRKARNKQQRLSRRINRGR